MSSGIFVWASAQAASADDFMVEAGKVLDPLADAERRQQLVMELSIGNEHKKSLASVDGVEVFKMHLGVTVEVPTEQVDEVGRQCSATVVIPRAALRKVQWMEYAAGEIRSSLHEAGRSTDMSRVISALVEADVRMNARKSLRLARETIDAPQAFRLAIYARRARNRHV
jgi:hypothetical protein